MDFVLQDVRYALRTLVNNPAVSALAVLCLAVGIGVNSAIYSVVDTISIRPLPFPDADQLVVLTSTRPADGVDRSGVSYPDFRDWRAGARAFAGMGAYASRSVTVTDAGRAAGADAERFLAGLISASLFPTLGVHPALGRQFAEADDRPGASGAVLLSDGVWRRRYLADPGLVGREISVNGEARTVVGIMPPGFRFPETTELWLPIEPRLAATPRDERALQVYARMKDGISLAQARTEIAAIARGLTSFRENDGWSASAIPLREEFVPEDIRLVSTTLMGAVTLVLLIACANVANLLLARAAARQREIAIRAALGAGRGRIVRQVLTESVIIALVTLPVGLAIAVLGLRWLSASVPPDADVPYYIDWSMNWRVVAYSAAAAVATGVLFGLAPALHAADTDLHRSLKDGGRGSGGSIRRARVRNALVVVEIALSLVLLVGASLFVRSFLNLQQRRVGIDLEPLMTMRFLMAGDGYEQPEARVRRVDDIVGRVKALPGVEAAFVSNLVPFNGGGGGSGAIAAGQSFERGKEPYVTYIAATPDPLPALGIPLLAGRALTPAEAATRSAVAVVNRDFARRVFGSDRDAIGQRFQLPAADRTAWFTAVGLVGEFHVWDASENEPTPIAFVGYPYIPSANSGLTIKVGGAAPASIVGAVREQIRLADAALPIFDVRSGDDNRRLTFWPDRLLGGMFTTFGVVALLLASIGLYGVLSYSVAQRSHEIGVRVALGAGRRDVLRLVLGQGARLAAAGIVLGALGAAAAGQVIRSLLFNVGAGDPASFIGMAAFLALVAFIAGYVPARRATAVDPIVALRSE